MDGLSFLARLMKHYPMPVVILSSLTPRNSELALKALDLGAVEVMCKPVSSFFVKNIANELAHAIRSAAQARVKAAPPRVTATPPCVPSDLLVQTTHKIIAIGASTGGTKALESVLVGLPASAPGTVIVQHMPEKFTTSFAERLDAICPVRVKEAENGDHVVPGVVLIAPGNRHMILNRRGATYMVQIKDGPRVHYQRPSVDVLFHSVANSAGRNSVGVILTGMGADGAKGLLALKQKGAATMAQDEASCVVFGMPKEAIRLNAADEIVPLHRMPAAILDALRKQQTATNATEKRKVACHN
jgi:two-component system chemotaxis response regulator CheB